jgi:hypothetical protein
VSNLVNSDACPRPTAGGIGLHEMQDQMQKLEDLLNEKNRATAELKVNAVSEDEMVLSVADYEALRNGPGPPGAVKRS